MYKHAILLLVAIFSMNSQSAEATPITNVSDPALMGASIQNFSGASGQNHTSFSYPDVTVTGTGTFDFGSGSDGSFVPPNPSGDTYISDHDGNIEFLFTDLVSAFAIQIGSINVSRTLEAYDFGGYLIESLSIMVANDGFMESIRQAGISRALSSTAV